MKSKQIVIFIIIGLVFGGILFACSAVRPMIAPGAETKEAATAEVSAFEDVNGNGKWDGDERPLPNTLIIAASNIHGGYTQSATLTDADGKATVSASYTHYFDVGAIAPCGYTATTPASLSVADAGLFAKYEFGFQPESEPATILAKSLDFHLWHDLNRDGRYQEQEPSLANAEIAFAPRLDFSDSVMGYDVNGLTAVTDDTGHATLNVGNGCGTMAVIAKNEWDTTSFVPDGIQQENGEITFDYNEQKTTFDWGMSKYQYFNFSAGGAYHPEGFGEWRISLNTTGALTIRHQVGDETTDYGIVTLTDEENQTIWGLIAAANIEAMPKTFQRPGIPDETAYSFSLHTPDQIYMTETWVDDAKQDPNLQALVDQLLQLIDQYTATTYTGG